MKKLKELMVVSKAMASAEQDGGSPEPRFDDFPSAEGLLPIQGLSGAAAAARHRHVLVVGGGIEIQKGFFVIFSLFWIVL